MSYRVYLERRPERASYILVIERRKADGTIEHMQLVPTKVPRHQDMSSDKLNWLDDHEANELMLAFVVEARKHNIRPSLEASDIEGLRRHLEDMRAITFAKLEVDKP